MTLKYSGDIRELCYPFIYEDSPLCDYEIITDELCATLGGVISELEGDERFADIYDFLDKLQPRIFHMNGSVRGKQAIFEEQIQWLAGYFDQYQKEIEGQLHGFVLPRGGRLTVVINRRLGIVEPEYQSLSYNLKPPSR
ncbi:hypothetical protein CAPTEDRAFT_215503, partial [Capitella teleta]